AGRRARGLLDECGVGWHASGDGAHRRGFPRPIERYGGIRPWQGGPLGGHHPSPWRCAAGSDAGGGRRGRARGGAAGVCPAPRRLAVCSHGSKSLCGVAGAGAPLSSAGGPVCLRPSYAGIGLGRDRTGGRVVRRWAAVAAGALLMALALNPWTVMGSQIAERMNPFPWPAMAAWMLAAAFTARWLARRPRLVLTHVVGHLAAAGTGFLLWLSWQGGMASWASPRSWWRHGAAAIRDASTGTLVFALLWWGFLWY